MKIAQVIPYLNPRRGGDFGVCSNLSKYLSLKGHEVTIVTTDFEFDQSSETTLRSFGVDVIPFRRALEYSKFIYTPSMDSWLKDEQPDYDVIHIHSYRSHQCILMGRYATRSGTPFVLQPHGSMPIIVEKKIQKAIFDALWGKKTLHKASRIIAVSSCERDQIMKFGVPSESIPVVRNAIDIQGLQMRSDTTSLRDCLCIPDGTRVIGYLGRIHRRKGLEFLLYALEKIVARAPDTVLLIAGPDDGYAAELRARASNLGLGESVRFLGYVESKSSFYKSIDLLVYPAVHEIFGLVPFEALFCGTPVVVANDSGCGELIGDNGIGYLVDYGDEKGLVNVVFEALRNDCENHRMIEEGKKYILDNLTWEHVVGLAEEIYEDCIRDF